MRATVVGLALVALVSSAIAEDPAATVLLRAYPEQLSSIEGSGPATQLVWRDGTRMAFSDGGLEKNTAAWLASPDLRDMFRHRYPGGDGSQPPRTDPGRARPAAFFTKIYGNCRNGGVTPHLVDVVWLPTKSGQRLKVTRINGVAQRLQAISNALDALPASFDRYLKPSAGTYVCRPIAGTQSPSAHSFGIAIDLSTAYADYWRWSPGGISAYQNKIPPDIVRIFEAHGFIWGGRWQHFDTMHFEYRPELLQPTVALPAVAMPPPSMGP
jgi:hypothetical protein